MIEEIRNWRNKYPGAYDDLDDFTLAKMIANKWPGEYDDLPDKVRAGGIEPITGTEETVLRKPPPGWLEGAGTAAEIGAMTYGGVKGGAAGMAIAGPPGAAVGAAIGGGLGYAAARQAKQISLQELGYRERQPIIEQAKRAATDVPVGMAIEMTGQVVGVGGQKVIGKLLAPMGDYLETPIGKELAGIYKQYGIKPLPGELKPGSKTFGIIESVLGYRPLSGDVMVNRAMKNVELLNNVREQLIAKSAPNETVEVIGKRIKDEVTTILERHGVKKMGKLNVFVDKAMNSLTSGQAAVGKHEAGTMWINTMEQGKEIIEGHVRTSYTKVAGSLPAGGDIPVPQISTNAIAGEIFEQESRAGLPLARVKKIAGAFRGKTGAETAEELEAFGVSEKMLARDPELASMIADKQKGRVATWNSMDHDQSVLGDKIRQLRLASGGKDTKETHQLGRLRSAILDDMETFAKDQGPETWKLYQQAKQASQFYHDVFDKDILRIMNKHPEDVVDTILKKGKDSVTYLRQVNLATGNAGIEPLRRVAGTRLFETSTKGGVIDPVLLKKNWANIPSDTKNMLFNTNQSTAIENVINNGEKLISQMKGTKTVEFLDTLMGTDNHMVVRSIFQAESQYPAMLTRKILGYLKDPVTKKLSPNPRFIEIQSKAIENIIKLSGEGKVLTGQALKDFQKYNATLKELFKNADGSVSSRYNNFQSFLKASLGMKRAEQLAVNASQTGQILLGSQIGSKILGALAKPISVVAGATAGTTMGGALGGVAGAAASLAFPWAISKIYTSEMAARYFTRAIHMNPASKEAISLFTNAILILSREEIERTGETQKTGM